MRIIKVTDQSEIQDFIDFPFKLYNLKNSSWWVPPMNSDMEFSLDSSRHPFYDDPGSDAQCFLAESDGTIEGRIMVIESGPYNKVHGTSTAFFYFFETVENEEVANALFNAAFDWAKSRGLDKIMGPTGLLAGDGHGILVEGFARRPGMGMPWNPPFYKKLVEYAGFEKRADTLSAQVSLDIQAHRDLIGDLYNSAKKVKKQRGLRVKTFDSKQAIKDEISWLAPELCNVYNKSFEKLPFFHPMDEAKMRRIINRLLGVSSHRSVKLFNLAMKEDKVIGFLLAYPNIVSGLRRAGGELWPLGWLYLTAARRFTSWVDANGIGILPGFQGTGAAVVMYAQLIKSLEKSRFQHLIINQVLEENHNNLREMKIFGVTEFDRVHRIYQRQL